MKKSTKKSDFLSTLILILVLITGLSLLIYPSFSNMWNQRYATHAIEGYAEQIMTIDTEEYDRIWQAAVDYNKTLPGRESIWEIPEEERALYKSLLLVGSEKIMGYVDIPGIDVELPIYHGTEDSVLQVAIGHLEWSSLPVGGESTHCVMSGHRGLPSARLFTDLDKMAVGDIFMLHVLDETLTYEVDQIRIVEPHETEELLIQEGKDLCTLFTCTPYGVNSHRLLVRGHRIENMEEAQIVRVTADAMIVEKLVVAPFVLAPILLVMLIVLLIQTSKKPRRNVK